MEPLKVECLRCGETRTVDSGPWRVLEADDCPRCHYVGWAPAGELSETLRRALRDRPPERRHLRVA